MNRYIKTIASALTVVLIWQSSCKVEGDIDKKITTLPTVETNAVNYITSTCATLGGKITYEGMPAYTERGVVYATTQEPTINDNIAKITGTGSYSIGICDLSPNTTYYGRAYAINAVDIAYGEQVSFTTSGILPTLTTNAVTNVTSTFATLGGNITDAGIPAYTERGVVYATTENPTVDDYIAAITGTETGNYSIEVCDLTPNTTYYFRAYTINAAGIAYGEQVSFTTPGILPTLTTNAVTNVTSTCATLGGNITDAGIPAYIERGVVYATTPNPTTNDNIAKVTGTETGNYSIGVCDLSPNTTYYVRAYAINAEGIAYGEQVSFIKWYIGYPNVADVIAILNNGTLTISGSGAMQDFIFDENEELCSSPWYSLRSLITTMNIEQGVTNIGDRAFYNCNNLTTVDIPNSIKHIGEESFFGCTGLTTFDIPSSVTNINHGAFRHCNFSYIFIPQFVSSINGPIFENCNKLTVIEVDEANGNYSSQGGVLFNKDKTKLVGYPGGVAGGYSIPETVQTIGAGSFASCEKLTSIIIPNSVKTIEINVFWACFGLKTVSIGSSVTSIGWAVFEACFGLTDVMVHWKDPSMVSINPFAFGHYAPYDLKNVNLHIPVGTYELYSTDLVWKEFNIVK